MWLQDVCWVTRCKNMYISQSFIFLIKALSATLYDHCICCGMFPKPVLQENVADTSKVHKGGGGGVGS